MSKRKEAMSAAELMAKLEADPAFIAKREEEDAEREARAAEWRRAEAPLVAELRTLGLEVDSVWDLVDAAEPYPQALPLLVENLQRPYPSRVREGIARALAIPEARSAWTVLLRAYREEEAADAKEGLAVALAAVDDDEALEELIDLLDERAHGPSRLHLLRALARSESPRAQKALSELEADPELVRELRALRRRPAP